MNYLLWEISVNFCNVQRSSNVVMRFIILIFIPHSLLALFVNLLVMRLWFKETSEFLLVSDSPGEGKVEIEVNLLHVSHKKRKVLAGSPHNFPIL